MPRKKVAFSRKDYLSYNTQYPSHSNRLAFTGATDLCQFVERKGNGKALLLNRGVPD